MMTLVWTDSLKVGIEIMDTGYRDLLMLLARFPGSDDAQFTRLFSELVNHLSKYFDHEHRLMRTYDYFAYTQHLDEHETILADARARYDAAVNGHPAEARAFIATQIEPWFINHRNTIDWVTAQFLQGDTCCGCSVL